MKPCSQFSGGILGMMFFSSWHSGQQFHFKRLQAIADVVSTVLCEAYQVGTISVPALGVPYAVKVRGNFARHSVARKLQSLATREKTLLQSLGIVAGKNPDCVRCGVRRVQFRQ